MAKHFDHNFGHGKRFLANRFATLIRSGAP